MKTTESDTLVLDDPKAKAAVRPADETTRASAPKELTIFLDGKFVPEAEAKVSVFDHGLLYGDGI
ncbi:MAG: hypothetical protein ACXV8A_04795, partial [Chthoniobacterales bacterium]